MTGRRARGKTVNGRWWLVAGVLLLGTLRAGAQNLVVNPDFDGALGIDAWQGGPLTLLEWSSSDWQGDPASGSARLSHFAPCGNTYMFQCVVPSAPLAASYELGATVYLESPPQVASAHVAAHFYADAGCQVQALGTFQSGVVNQQGTWVSLLNGGMVLPPATQSVRILLVLSKIPFIPSCLPPLPTVVARFDHVRFGPTGTTPVTLESLSIE